MSKLKKLFGGAKKNKKPETAGTLETDAVPIEEENANNEPIVELAPSPGVSMDILPTNSQIYGESNGNLMPSASGVMANGIPGGGGAPVFMHSGPAQQQVVMQFSNVDNLHIGSVYHIKGNQESAPAPRKTSNGTLKSHTKQKTKSIALMMQSKEELSHPMIKAMSWHLGKGWKEVMRELGFTQGQIEQSILDNQAVGGLKEVIYSLVESYVQQTEDEEKITLGYVTTLLWQHNFRECVYQMKVKWKQMKLENDKKEETEEN